MEEVQEEDKKDKKLVFLSKSVLQKVRERPMVTGTQIANEILEMYKDFCEVRIYLQLKPFRSVKKSISKMFNAEFTMLSTCSARWT